MEAREILEKMEREIKEEERSEYPERSVMGKKKIGDSEIVTVANLHHNPEDIGETYFGIPTEPWKVDIMMSTPHYTHLSSYTEEFLKEVDAVGFFETFYEELQDTYDHTKELI